LLTGRPGEIIRRHTGHAVRELVELGEERLATTLSPRPRGVFLRVSDAKPGKASTGNYRRNLNSRVSGLNAMISDGGVVYGPWLESGGRGTRFKGYASFRRTADWLDEKKKGVMGRHMDRAERELEGR